MEQPVICVIVPVYKAEATLPRCIESVLTQQLPGGLRLILVDDQSPDRSGEICDAYAAKDPRVMVLHRRERGVSGARNAGLRAATGEYIVFLDSDDALRPGALAAALAAQAAAPNAFVLWHYTMQPDDTTPVTTVAHPAQQSDLARLHLDCLIAMPWNKLYRRTYARQLAFDQAYTLGEDLQFVLDYLALLGRCQPDFSYLVLESALTFYGAVCRDEDWKRIPVVMLSAVPISVREHAFATIGLTQGPLPAPAACLEKPCTPEALLEVVNRLVPEPTTA